MGHPDWLWLDLLTKQLKGPAQAGSTKGTNVGLRSLDPLRGRTNAALHSLDPLKGPTQDRWIHQEDTQLYTRWMH